MTEADKTTFYKLKHVFFLLVYCTFYKIYELGNALPAALTTKSEVIKYGYFGGSRVSKIDALGWGPDLYLEHQHLTTWK